MKKLFLAIAAVAALLASCSKDDAITGVSKSQVTFTVSAPEMETRAGDYGNGTQATELYYAVYDAVEGTSYVKGLSKVEANDHLQLDEEGKATVTINLVEGRTYDIIFYAEHNFAGDDPEAVSPYSIDWANRTLSVASNLTANQETYDAFYAHVDNLKVGTAAINETVYLRRPFAQLNVLTNDLDKGAAAGIDIAQTSVTVKNIYTKMNLFTDKVDPASETAVTYALSDVLRDDNGAIVSAVVDNTTYHWLTMNYLLVNDKKMVDVEFTMTDSSVAQDKDATLVRNYATVPVERNHRTNIYGSIITNPAVFNVEIDEEFLTPDHDYPADNVVTTTEELQAALDAATDGSTIILEEGVNYGVVYFGRPTKNNTTTMYCETHNYTTTNAAEFAAHLAEAEYHTTPRYTTTLKNVTILGAKGATIAGLLATSGHIYGDVYDYVLDKDYDAGSAYYHTLHLENINFYNVAFTGKVDINTSQAESIYNGITFDGCTFTTGGIESGNGPAIRYYNEANNGNVKNIVVKNCTFNNCYQGVYVHHVNGISVTDSEFNTTGHNAIAMQGHNGTVNLKDVVIKNNTFNNIGDRVIRFNEIGADSNITIQYNTATDSGDDEGEIMKATSIESGITTNIGFNNWGEGKIVVNDELKDKSAEVTTAAELQNAIKNGVKNIFFANDITVDKWIMFSETLSLKDKIITVGMDGLTIDGNGHTLTVNSIESGSNGNDLFDEATNLNISNLTIKYADGVAGGAISLKSGNISKVNFNGGDTAIYPGTGEIKVEECTFATKATAIYYEDARDNLTVNNCTFTQPDNTNVILLRGNVKFTNNKVNSGRTVNIVSGSPEVTGNNFNNVRLKVYTAATATIANNTINVLEFSDDNPYSSTFTNNTMSADAQAVLDAATKN